MANRNLLFVGIRGTAIALDRATGEIVWQADLSVGLSRSFVHLMLDGDNLYATTQGEVVCLDPATGSRRWHNPLKGYGVGLASLAFPNAAYGGSISLMAEKRLRDEQSGAAGAGATF